MDTSSFRPGESHIAQQSRRDKLRVQASSTSVQHLDHDFPNNSEQLSVHSGLDPDLVQVRNVRNANMLYDPNTAVFSSGMLNFATSSGGVLPAPRTAMVDQELGAVQHSRSMPWISSFSNMSHQVSSNINASPRANSSEPQACSNWRSSDTQQYCYDWMVNYASGSVGRENNQKHIFVGDVLSNNVRVTNISTPTQYVKPIYNGYQSVQSSLANPSSEIPCQDSQKHHREIHSSSNMHPLYQDTLADVVTPASSTGGAYGNQSTDLCFDNANAWMNRPVDNCHQWSSEMGLITRKNGQELRTLASDPNTQVLSLSLSSYPPSRGNITQFEEGYESEYLQSKSGVPKESQHQDSKFKSSNYLFSMSKPAIISRSSGKSLNDIVGTSNNDLLHAGPLGPFTGYATILRSSKFLKPAQQLLDEFCSAAGLKHLKTCEESARTSGAGAETGAKGYTNSSDVSLSTFHRSNELSGDVTVASSSYESIRPEYQQKKAKLLYLQEEVCRRYKQYHQQMQMVASSFESVAGLSAATPYVSLALKTVSRNFRCLKHAILDQLKHVIKALGEDLLSPNTGTSSSKGDTSTSRLRYTDQSFQRYRSTGSNVGFFESQQHVWRPHRGLPERSVAVLRAWLFEHFLHPYPTDTDKHMLATQTGLSRNQVSNWFINARVRVWKPMVEEIHMLETKGLAENRACGNLDGKSAEGTSQPIMEQPSSNMAGDSMINKQLECSGTGSSSGSEEELDAEQWNQEKRSRIELQVPTSMDGSVMNFLPYQRTSGIDIGGLGAVSLTLGLRHSVEHAQQQHPPLQQHDDQLRRQVGGQMIHDYAG